ncbi:MAG TPA: hypothetical protein VGJ20_36890 [Xanthobacteraceae bacterium]
MPQRPEVHRWYCTASWARRRRHRLRVEPLCRLCLEAGRVTPAVVADHIERHEGDYQKFRIGELRSLCATCHNNLGANNAPRRSAVGADGTPSDPAHWWNTGSWALPCHTKERSILFVLRWVAEIASAFAIALTDRSRHS